MENLRVLITTGKYKIKSKASEISIDDIRNKIKELIIHDDCKYIYNFTGTNLENIIFNEKLEVIGAFAFQNNKKLKQIVLPPSLKKISYSTFGGCENLENITFNSFPRVSYEFQHCPNLKKIVFNDVVTSKNYTFDLKDYELIYVDSSNGDSIIIKYGNGYEEIREYINENLECYKKEHKLTNIHSKFINNNALTIPYKYYDLYLKFFKVYNDKFNFDTLDLSSPNLKNIKIVGDVNFKTEFKKIILPKLDVNKSYNVEIYLNNTEKTTISIQNNNIDSLDNNKIDLEISEKIDSIRVVENNYIIHCEDNVYIITTDELIIKKTKHEYETNTIDTLISKYSAESKLKNLISKNSILKQQLIEIKEYLKLLGNDEIIKFIDNLDKDEKVKKIR